jgi:hypothetical protein
MIYVNSKVLEFWVMEITSIYDFLHLLNLIKNRPNIDFGGGGIWHLHIYATILLFFSFQREWRKTHKQDRSKM